MELIVRQGDREEKVRVRRIDEGYEVAIGDNVYHVDAAALQNGARSLRINGAQHEVSVRRHGESWVVASRQGAVPVDVVDPLTHLAQQTRGGKGGRRQQRVDAYMPGRVVAVLVQEGDEVAAGQGIVVLEAMKMENEIRAEHEGKILKIHVQPGQAVDAGNPLFELEERNRERAPMVTLRRRYPMSHRSIPILALVAALMAGITLPLPVLAQDAPPPAGEHEHHQHHPSNHEHHAAPAPREDAPESGKATSVRVPDLTLVDQNGKPVRFYSDLVQGKVVMINFVFTSCTTICPPMGATFGKVRQLLGDRAGRDVHLISVSVDPVTDTPERMKAWGAKFGSGPGWTLVTGDRETVAQLLKALGAYNADINDHTPLVLAGNDPQGQWTRAYGLAAPAKLVEMVDGLAAQTTAKKEAQ